MRARSGACRRGRRRPGAAARPRRRHRRSCSWPSRSSPSSVCSRPVPPQQCRQERGLPDELRSESRERPVIQVVGRAPLLEATGPQQADAVGEREGVLLIVRHHQRGGPERLEQRAQLAHQPLAQRDVEARERLVEQHRGRPRRERPRQRHPLLLPAGQFGGVRVHAVSEAHELEQLAGPVATLAARESLQAELHVAACGQVREQRVVLEYEPDAALVRRDVHARASEHPAARQHLAGVERLEPGDAAQCRRLAATTRAQQAANLPLLERETHAVEGTAVAEAPHGVAQLKPHGSCAARAGSPAPRPRPRSRPTAARPAPIRPRLPSRRPAPPASRNRTAASSG